MLGGDCFLDIYTIQRFNWNYEKQAKLHGKFGLYLSVTVKLIHKNKLIKALLPNSPDNDPTPQLHYIFLHR